MNIRIAEVNTRAYRAALVQKQTWQRMSRTEEYWGNAVAERFCATVEHALLAHTVRHSHREAHLALTDFIEHWYNVERQRSRFGYVSRQQYEHQLRHMARTA